MAKTITLELTEEEFDTLEDVVWMYTDEGPPDNGWASNELTQLRVRIVEAKVNAKSSQTNL